jgi:hypothetical protein
MLKVLVTGDNGFMRRMLPLLKTVCPVDATVYGSSYENDMTEYVLIGERDAINKVIRKLIEGAELLENPDLFGGELGDLTDNYY